MSRAIFDHLVHTCAVDLFRTYNAHIERAAELPRLDRVAVIGFAGDGIRGALGLGVGTDLLSGLAIPQPGAAPACFDDWLAETANQLLGRIKNRLLAHGPAIALALPMVMRGVRIQLSSDTSEVWAYPFDSASGPLCVWLDVSMQPGLVIRTDPDPTQMAAGEGDLVLF